MKRSSVGKRLVLALVLAASSPAPCSAQGAYPDSDQRSADPQGDIDPRIPGIPGGPRLPPGFRGYGGGQLGADIDELYRRRPMPNGSAEFPNRMLGPRGAPPFGRPNGEAKQRQPAPKPPTPAERAAQIRKALAPKPALAFVRRHTLDDLFGKLSGAKDEDEAKGIAAVITKIWMRSGSDTADLMMQRSMQAIDKKDYKVALDLLDHLVEIRPGWAEAWNKRASVRFFTGNLDGAMADVEHVLKLEPKHFGALVGMASILQHTGFEKRALDVYRHALSIYPHQPEVEKITEKLTLEVEGQGI